MTAKILVVDDEPDILALAKRILEPEDYHIITASSAMEGLQKAETETPNLILLDIRMLKTDGIEACRILKKQPKTKSIPVVMFTALTQMKEMNAAKEAGCSGYLIKPFMPESLRSEVKKHIKK
ncbi:hypothetical protein A3K80_03830 [Candidatus Bathyarchaeota archaeon RBG_13_38_9]|nr:MAG: hypothetical protein A3K80_03830 [Candidatus Bathyarchaeota archaeon RBG_13_38_9]